MLTDTGFRSFSEVASRIGEQRQHVGTYRDGAEVYQTVKENPNINVHLLLDKAQHLAAIHKAPEYIPQMRAEAEVAEAINSVVNYEVCSTRRSRRRSRNE